MERVAQLTTGRRSRWLVVVAWAALALALAPLQGRLQAEGADESDAFQAASAESTRASALIAQRFDEGAEAVTVIAYTRSGGLRAEDNERLAADARALCAPGVLSGVVKVITPSGLACGDPFPSAGPSSPAVGPVSQDGTTALVTVQTRDDATDVVEADVAAIRAAVPDPDASGLRALVTGETAFAADQSAAFEGIDETLLAITAVLILVLLLVVYRSPVAAAVPLLIVSVAYLVAAGIIYGLARAGILDVTGQATAILIVLMFGAGTDYCLLVIARFREELGRGAQPAAALRSAASRSGPAILSAGAIVVVAMLVLVLADYRATATMGPVLAVGTAVTVLAGLTLLPALLALLGPRTFWPVVPERKPVRSDRLGLWARIGGFVRRRPWPTIAAVSALLLAGSFGALEDRGALSFADSFRDPPESVRAQTLVAEKFGAGVLGPAEVVVASRASGIVVDTLGRAPGVRSAAESAVSRDRELTLVELLPERDPFSQEAIDAVPALRERLRAAAAGETALLGGPAAEGFDSREALRSDATLIVPLTLALVLLIVAVLVRAIVAPLYLVATVVVSYAFALGASSLFFTHVLGQPDSDPALPSFAFVFLVALGVDYNVFLISRIREERRHRQSRDAVIAGLERSGGVITSAGLILAGTFCTLIALDVVGLAQVGFTVAFGLLVDTFLVRCFLVPAIAVVLGDRSWWPTRPARAPLAKVAACALAAAVIAAGALPQSAHAETFTVRTTWDAGPGSLREAVTAAEDAPGADLIDIAVTGSIVLRSTLPDLHSDVTIRGPGAGALTVTRSPSAEYPFRLLTAGPEAVVEVHGLRLSGGRVEERSNPTGGGVHNAGRMRLADVVVAGNEVHGQVGVTGGGGIANSGTLEVVRSVVEGNRAASSEGSAAGGGIYNLGTLLVQDTTIAGNARAEGRAGHGAAGIEHAAGVALVRRSTVARNHGTGIHNAFAELAIDTTTVSGNQGGVSAIGGRTTVRSTTVSGAGGRGPNLAGLQVDIPSELTVENSMLADPGTGWPDCVTTAQVEARSLGHNLADDASCGYLTAPGDRPSVEPGLGPLADNGGLTATHAFAPGSPAHDQGRSGPLGTDQRGSPRPVDAPAVADAAGGDGGDIGALELAAIPVAADPPLASPPGAGAGSPAPGGTPPPAGIHPPATVPPAPAPPAALPPAGSPPAGSPPAGSPPAPMLPVVPRRSPARVRLGAPRRATDGSVRLRARLPAAGRMTVTGRGARAVARRRAAAGWVTVSVRPTRATARRLARHRTVRVRLLVKFRPSKAGTAQKLTTYVRLTGKSH